MKSLEQLVQTMSPDELKKFKDIIEETRIRQRELIEMRQKTLRMIQEMEQTLTSFLHSLFTLKSALLQLQAVTLRLNQVTKRVNQNSRQSNARLVYISRKPGRMIN